MKRGLLIRLTALLGAAALFSGSTVYAASRMEVAAPPPQPAYDDDFLQEIEPGIADLLASFMEENSSMEESSEPSSVETSSAPSSEAPSSAPVSSTAPVSSKPVSSLTASSEAASSAPTSSEAPSSEVSSEGPSSEEEVVPPDISGDDAELLDMLAGAVQREIIGVNTPPQSRYYEAYKAQAVAAHTYMEYHRQRTGSYPTMSYCTPDPKTVELVSEVLHELIYYNGSVINASYHAASGGHTQSAVYVWGTDVPYLIGVESAYDDYEATANISVSTMEQKLSSAGISVSGDPSDWFDLSGASLTDGGFIETIQICGTTVKGRTLRENILGTSVLKSPKIVDISTDGSTFSITTRGFGHGAGLSQQGALGYAANEGWSYRDILTHYYVGVSVG